MKKTFFICLILLFATININAQLKVDSIGRIRLNNKVAVGSSTDFTVNSGLQTYKSITNGTYYGLYSKIELDNTSGISSRSIIPIYGLLKTINLVPERSTSALRGRFTAAVVGVAQSGIGIYGANGTSLPVTLTGNYAGYFDGNVKTTGTMTAASYVTSSDRRLKTDISDLSFQTRNLIYSLRPVSYKIDATDTLHFRYNTNAQEVQNVHFGLVAQELKEIYPNLVYENEADGYLCVNYQELIPVLIDALQEQNERIEALESRLSAGNAKSEKKSSDSFSDAKLYQNNPNPFNQSTIIKYDLPLETSQANLYIYDMTGAQIASYSITDFGSSSITISAGNLKAGMYLYSLIADGQIIDTKQMILTK